MSKNAYIIDNPNRSDKKPSGTAEYVTGMGAIPHAQGVAFRVWAPHAEMGVNAIELMPVMTFPGERSWGYNPSHPFAVESSYGGPRGLKRFIRAAHQRGIAVILDVVYNHMGPGGLDMWQFDGWSQN